MIHIVEYLCEHCIVVLAEEYSMLRLCVFASLLCVAFTLFVCSENYCDTVKCGQPPVCKYNQVLGASGLCGCCMGCITILGQKFYF